jgi:hypothetical protein
MVDVYAQIRTAEDFGVGFGKGTVKKAVIKMGNSVIRHKQRIMDDRDAEIRKFIEEELLDAPLANYEENDFNAGYQAGLDWVLKYVLKGGGNT